MAALIVESARAARREAERMRLASQELRNVVRESNRVAQVGTARAAAAEAAASRCRGRARSLASPWSCLEWRREDEQLSRVLVPLD